MINELDRFSRFVFECFALAEQSMPYITRHSSTVFPVVAQKMFMIQPTHSILVNQSSAFLALFSPAVCLGPATACEPTF